jgi:hypothetical protein
MKFAGRPATLRSKNARIGGILLVIFAIGVSVFAFPGISQVLAESQRPTLGKVYKEVVNLFSWQASGQQPQGEPTTLVQNMQTAVNKTVCASGCDFMTIAAAVNDVNTNGVPAGGVTYNVAAEHTETAPAGGYSITASGTATDQIIFQKSGTGANPTVTAPTPQTAGNLNDAIFKIIGGDYITIDGFTMLENAANTTTTTASNNMTEWGVALLYASTTNGAQNNTIRNNTIDLNRTYTNTFGIYSNVRHSATAPTTTADITAPTGANSNNKFYSNNITDVNLGIVVVGSTTGANMDTGLDVGGTAVGTGNTITDYGTAAPASGFISVSGTVYGIF